MNFPDRLQCAADGRHLLTLTIGHDHARDAWPGLRWKQELP
jgi:hypothetical protein